MTEEQEDNTFWIGQIDILKLQSRIAELENHNKELTEALKKVAFLKFRSDIHPSLQGDKAIEIAKKALKP